MKYIYFVSYNYKDINGTGFGNIEIISDHLYTKISHIRDCEEVINRTQEEWRHFKCAVNNYILLGNY